MVMCGSQLQTRRGIGRNKAKQEEVVLNRKVFEETSVGEHSVEEAAEEGERSAEVISAEVLEARSAEEASAGETNAGQASARERSAEVIVVDLEEAEGRIKAVLCSWMPRDPLAVLVQRHGRHGTVLLLHVRGTTRPVRAALRRKFEILLGSFFAGSLVAALDPMKRTAGPSTDAQGRLLATNPACWFKETCPQADQAAHYASYSHPCKYGEKCYRKNPDHFERYIYMVLEATTAH